MVDELLSRQLIEALAVCLLQSFINPDHENKIRELIDTHYPGLFVSTSASVLPYAREYERWTSTVINAFTQPLVDRYLNNIDHGLKRRGLDASLYIMTSSGGADARIRPRCRRTDICTPRTEAGYSRRPVLRHGRHDGQGRNRA